jgi:hypothetical protein
MVMSMDISATSGSLKKEFLGSHLFQGVMRSNENGLVVMLQSLP